MGNWFSCRRKGRAKEEVEKASLLEGAPSDPLPPAYEGFSPSPNDDIVEHVRERWEGIKYQSERPANTFALYNLLNMAGVIKALTKRHVNVHEQEAAILLVLQAYNGKDRAQWVMEDDCQGHWKTTTEIAESSIASTEVKTLTLALDQLRTLGQQLKGMAGFDVNAKARDTADAMVAILDSIDYPFNGDNIIERRRETSAGMLWLEARISEL